MEDLQKLLDKIIITKDLLERAEEFMAQHRDEWEDGFIIHFEKYLEDKREYLYFEENLAERLGWRVALEIEKHSNLDI